MKKLGLLVIILFSARVFAIDSTVFEENYPGFHDYESMSLTNTRNYFRALFSKSIQTSNREGFRVLEVQNEDWKTSIKISMLIERKIGNNEIIETVKYQLSSGGTLDYTLSRKGPNLKPLSDTDLLMFKFQSLDTYSSYDLIIPTFNVNYHRDISPGNETSFFLLGFMNFNIGINTQTFENEINRDYIYFYSGMNVPQQQLTVNVKEHQGTWEQYEYLHYTRGVGILTPKQFYNGLNDGASMFAQSGMIYQSILYSIGFPKFD